MNMSPEELSKNIIIVFACRVIDDDFDKGWDSAIKAITNYISMEGKLND